MSSPNSEAPRRLPLSCENCRRRKIRCISADHHAPCETCSRRGYASSCRFKRESPPRSPAALNVNLERQISSLDSLLKQNIEATTTLLNQPTAASALLSPPPSCPESTAFGSPPAQSGRLLISPSNHVRYVPFQGVGDACFLDAIQDPGRGLSAGFPFFMEKGMADPSRELLDLLPPTRQCDELIGVFFDVISPLFHILHDPSFHSKYQLFRSDPRSAPPSFMALLFVLLALAITTLDDDNPILMDLGREGSPSANIRTLAARYRSASMRCLVADNFMWHHNLCTMQCLVLLIYAINHAQGSAWSLLGTALHIAVAIGCSVDPALLDVDPIEVEERRRCWAALKMLYTIQNTCLGNIAPFKLQADVALPADVDDEDLLRTQVPAGHAQSPDKPPTKMSYILYKFRLYNLAFDICRFSSAVQLPDRTMVDRLDARLLVEQQSHLTRFSDIHSLPVYHIAHFHILSNYTNHLSLLLHRPCLAVSGSEPSMGAPAYYQDSLERCEQSALKILSNFESFHTNVHFKPYRWYLYGLGSFHAFLAITSLAVILSRSMVPPATKIMITKTISNCVQKMQQTAARSEVCAKTLSILEPIIEGLPRTRDYQEAVVPRQPSGSSTTTLLPPELDALDWESLGSAPQLESLLQAIPCEQWLMPSGFPWEI